MRAAFLLAAVQAILSSFKPVASLSWRREIKLRYIADYPRTNEDSCLPPCHLDRRPCFIFHAGSSTKYTGNASSKSNAILAKPDDVEDVVQELYASLKEKKVTFTDLQNRLNDAGINLGGCKRPDDVIRRVAQLEVLGKDRLEEEIRKDDPKFQLLLEDVYKGKLSEYQAKPKEDRWSYIAALKSKITARNVELDVNFTDEHVIRLASEIEASDKIAFQLPSTKPENNGTQRIDSYRDEADSIFAVYRRIKEDKTRDEFMSQIKEELTNVSVDYKDCKKDDDLINRLAYARVFPYQDKKKQKHGHKFSLKPKEEPINNVFKHDHDPLRNLFDLGGLGDFFDLGSGIFDNDQEMPNIFSGNGNMEGGFSVLKDIAKMFGVELGGSGKDKIVFDNHEAPPLTSQEAEGINMDEEDVIDESGLNELFRKVRERNDDVLIRILSKCAKDAKIREALKIASNDGYARAKEEYKDNKAVVYILEKLYERGVLE